MRRNLERRCGSCGFLDSEAGFRAFEKAPDVLMMLGNDEEGNNELDGDEEDIAVSALLGRAQEPGKDREERRVGKECRSRWSPYH